MTRQDEIAKLDLEQAKANFEIETDEGRFDPHDYDTIASIVICGQCPHYRHIETRWGLSLCKGEQMTGYCSHNINLKVFIDGNKAIWDLTPEQIEEFVREKIAESVMKKK